jgi:predicted ATPase
MHPEWARKRGGFPFTVPTIASLGTLDLDAPVVCFVGENGSGKSTLLEGIAIAASLPSAGAAGRAQDDPTLTEQLWLSRALKLTWRTRNNRGFFLRAEDFFGFQNLLKREREGARDGSTQGEPQRHGASLRRRSRCKVTWRGVPELLPAAPGAEGAVPDGRA